MAVTYPKRESHFAHKFCRVMTKAAIALELGSEVCWMLSVIVHQEDAKRYRGPANFWNDQLMGVAGISSTSKLMRIRDKAVKSGWLHYQPGGKGKIGLYWVLIPEQYRDITDGACDESPDYPFQSDSQNGKETERQTDRKRKDKPQPSNPNPSPSPKSKNVFRNSPKKNPEVGPINLSVPLVPEDFHSRERGYRHFEALLVAGAVTAADRHRVVSLWIAANHQDNPAAWFNMAMLAATTEGKWWGNNRSDDEASKFLRARDSPKVENPVVQSVAAALSEKSIV